MATKSEMTRARILDAAAATLSQQGYAAARLEDIAEAANTKAGSLYYHFASREELVMEVLRVSIDRITAAVVRRLAELPKNATHRERIHAAIEIQLATALNPHDAYTAAALRIGSNLPPNLRRPHYDMQRGFGNLWRELLKQAQDAGEIDKSWNLSVIRMLLMGALNWSIEWYRPDGALGTQEIARHLCNMMFNGLSSQQVPPEAAPAARKRPAEKPARATSLRRARA